MNTRLAVLAAGLLAGTGLLGLAVPGASSPDRLPYAAAGLTEREAAAHLLRRFTFGTRPGEVDRVVAMGLETWLDRQLDGVPEGDDLAQRLAGFPSLSLSAFEMSETYERPGRARRRALQEGVFTQEAYDAMGVKERRRTILAYMEAQGLRPQRELAAELVRQKLLRAVYSENQLTEVLTDFWYNHFNVSLRDGKTTEYLLAYERDAIRPHVLGSFRDLIGATARHPAMLLYLDNAQSTAPDGVRTTLDEALPRRRARAARERTNRRQADREAQLPEQFRRRRGINENYARELLELHTLGVDGGYTQRDIENVARAFTGWTVLPPGKQSAKLRERARDEGARAGFMIDDAFLFRADAHDAETKTLLGASFPAGGGIEEGERVLDLLAAHPSTARHIARKLAVRFVADDPPDALVDDLARVFQSTHGDLRAVVRAIAYAPAFWRPEAVQAKVKSPLELTASALRALDAEVHPTRALLTWIDKMGQPLYRHPAPTGYPDLADAWINAGTLLNRMNFALQLATDKIPGVRTDLLALNGGHEPESVEEALRAYVPLLLPEENVAATVALLLPVATAPDLAGRLDAAAPDTTPPDTDPPLDPDDALFDDSEPESPPLPSGRDADALARTVGVILGSPAFQRR